MYTVCACNCLGITIFKSIKYNPCMLCCLVNVFAYIRMCSYQLAVLFLQSTDVIDVDAILEEKDINTAIERSKEDDIETAIERSRQTAAEEALARCTTPRYMHA